MSPIYLHYLNALDVEALALTDDEILAAIEAGLAATVRGYLAAISRAANA